MTYKAPKATNSDSGIIKISGDISGTSDSITVSKIQGNSVTSQSLGVSQDGYILTWSNPDGYWKANAAPVSFTAGGDLSGTNSSQTVAKINGATVPVSGSLTDGYVLKASGASSLTYAPVNLAGGSSHVTGVLPTSNQAAQSMGGDISGTTSSATVAKIQGNSVTSQSLGVSQDGYILTWSNPDGYWKANAAPVSFTAGGDLSGTNSSQTVAKIHGNSVTSQSLGASQDGYVLTWSNADGYWKANPASSGSFTAGGDLSGNSSSQTVIKVQGNSVSSQSLGAAQDGYVLTWSNADGYWKAKTASSSSSSGGFKNILDFDFTIQSNQNLLTGGTGNKIIGGVTFFMPIGGLTSADVVNGTGVVLVVSSNSSAGFRILFADALPSICPYSAEEAVEIMWQVSVPAMSQSGEYVYCKLGDASVQGRIVVGYEYSSSKQAMFNYSDPPGSSYSTSTNFNSSNVTDDVFCIRFHDGSYAEAWTGTYSGGWPRSMKLRGYRTQPTVTDTWCAVGNNLYSAVEPKAMASSRTYTIKRVRVRTR